MAKSCRWVSNVIISILLKKGWLSDVTTRRISHLFSSALLTVPLRKLSIIGFSDYTFKWFRSDLLNRKFTVNLENSFSKFEAYHAVCHKDPYSPLYYSWSTFVIYRWKLNAMCGVPQGSILAPLLFLMYVSDVPMEVKCNLFFYADGTCLVLQSKNIKDIEKQRNEEFANIFDWFFDNEVFTSVKIKRNPSFLLLNILSKSIRS